MLFSWVTLLVSLGGTRLTYLGAVPAACDTISPGKLLKDFQSVVPSSGSQKHQREVRDSVTAR